MCSKAVREEHEEARSLRCLQGWTPDPPRRVVGHSRGERAVDRCDCLIDVIAALFNVSGRELRLPGRATKSVTRVRQVAMYVAHVALGLSMRDVGRGFGRDRTTVLHACHLIEDYRDDAEFDCIVALAERIARAALGMGCED